MKKKKYYMMLGMGVIFASTAGIAYAYLTADDYAENILGPAVVTTEITEEFVPPDKPGPGTRIHKSPRVLSQSTVSCYVRARIVFTNDSSQFCEPLNVSANWELGQDGYYYYKEPLEPGDTTPSIFDYVCIKEDIDERDLDPFEILVYTEAVQCGEYNQEQAWQTMKGDLI